MSALYKYEIKYNLMNRMVVSVSVSVSICCFFYLVGKIYFFFLTTHILSHRHCVHTLLHAYDYRSIHDSTVFFFFYSRLLLLLLFYFIYTYSTILSVYCRSLKLQISDIECGLCYIYRK